ncbi:MAG: ATP-binding cassette domain-containing protein [Methanosarcinales archaeon]|uniref:ATP-binding cassette domain-containing protein n=1 Tax=Candidatus Ethanoperedens thermophilum TaxID=2766897 RepID=A0A848D7L9_9EURY|nr:ATP-binding cassette domain-containing protein [Candidatus Ethanoperedens thermophilum]
MEIIKVEGLTKKYKIKNTSDIVVGLNNVSFTIAEGEILGVLGKSGAGKSTLLRILRGIEKFDEGEVTIDGVRLTPDSTNSDFSKVQKKTAMHSQRSFASWGQSILHNVMRKICAAQRGAEELPERDSTDYESIKDEAMEIIELVGLKNKYKYYYNILSGGEKQQVLLARQLAFKPRVLLLDEPATMSDPLTRNALLDTIKKVHEKLGLSIILVSHMSEVHEYLSDRLIMLENGCIVDEGSTSRVLKEFTRQIAEPVPLEPITSKTEKILRLKNVYKKYRLVTSSELIQTIEMKSINLSIPKGIIMAMIGPSAKGKTVLIRLLSGIEKPDDGEVLVNVGGEWIDISKYGRKSIIARQKVEVMHQEFGLMHNETISEQFAYRLGLKSIETIDKAIARAEEIGITDLKLDVLYRLADLPEDEAKVALKKMGLDTDIFSELFPSFPETEARKIAKPVLEAMNLSEDILDRHTYELSCGEEVRIAIALHMVSKPEILLLDEPFGDLDPLSLRDVLNAIKKLNKEFKITIIVVSHQLDAVKEIAHEAVFIEAGITRWGEPEEVCEVFLERMREIEANPQEKEIVPT